MLEWIDAVPYADFLAELERAGLTVRSFAELIGMNPNSITNYARPGELPQHIALVAVLVAEMAVRGVNYRTAIAKVAPTKKPRGGTRRGHFGGDRQASLDLESAQLTNGHSHD
ncbi:XRE family transcriptional regulator [uncultured Hoeflea sp.]|uniref:XRE family transcriptional regulator n=1 Tax=uncultured Hoeflea sp. TaxID=538666 RepID=UPI0030DB8E9F